MSVMPYFQNSDKNLVEVNSCRAKVHGFTVGVLFVLLNDSHLNFIRFKFITEIFSSFHENNHKIFYLNNQGSLSLGSDLKQKERSQSKEAANNTCCMPKLNSNWDVASDGDADPAFSKFLSHVIADKGGQGRAVAFQPLTDLNGASRGMTILK